MKPTTKRTVEEVLKDIALCIEGDWGDRYDGDPSRVIEELPERISDYFNAIDFGDGRDDYIDAIDRAASRKKRKKSRGAK
jgi:hypothetical protein